MKRFLVRNVVGVGLIGLGLTGCQSDRASTTQKSVAKASKPDDPTAWSGSDVTRDDGGSSKGLPRTSGLQGGWSSEARDIENSLGVGR